MLPVCVNVTADMEVRLQSTWVPSVNLSTSLDSDGAGGWNHLPNPGFRKDCGMPPDPGAPSCPGMHFGVKRATRARMLVTLPHSGFVII